MFYLAVLRFIRFHPRASRFSFDYNNHELLFSQYVVVLVTQHFPVIDVPFDMN